MLKPFHLSGRVRFSARMLAIVSVICALVAFAIPYIGFGELYLLGFPDGHITDYEKAVTAPLTALMWVHVAFGLYFLYSAIACARVKSQPLRFLIVVACFFLLIAITKFALPWYFGSYLGLDNGIGG